VYVELVQAPAEQPLDCVHVPLSKKFCPPSVSLDPHWHVDWENEHPLAPHAPEL
jgi:hypothetical protein